MIQIRYLYTVLTISYYYITEGSERINPNNQGKANHKIESTKPAVQVVFLLGQDYLTSSNPTWSSNFPLKPYIISKNSNLH